MEIAPRTRYATRLDINRAGWHNNLGLTLKAQGNFDEAIAEYREAIRVDPSCHAAHSNLGSALIRQGTRLDEAIAACLGAIELNPDLMPAFHNLGVAFLLARRFEESASAFLRIVERYPRSFDAHHSLGAALFFAGDYEQAWFHLYYLNSCYLPPPGAAQWKGEPLDGEPLVLHATDGFGDVFQFARYVNLLHDRGERIILFCRGELVPILSTIRGAEQVLTYDAPMPTSRYHACLVSLPGILGSTPETSPDAKCLKADPDLVQLWSKRLAGIPGFRVGCVWAGTKEGIDCPRRSYPLSSLAPLARIPGVSLLSLQVGRGLDELREVDFPIVDLGADLTATPGSFVDGAAVVANLDLIVSCDTGACHFAGALGARTWTALPFTACWRWALDPNVSPWYPTMTLFRQETPGDWDGVFERMADALRALVSEGTHECR